jgi:UDP-N-acetylglucosamine--N-acetylmuramyl-(pentapeptide) pyrophosphoryl-undecaprenol N-acetylglucosamine transferase
MKILFTGGGSGGHFYPIIAISQQIHAVCSERKLIEPEMHFFAPSPYNEKLLFDNKIYFQKVSAGKIRRYFSPLNIIDWFKTGIGIISAMWKVFWLYPDVIFSKGGYGSFPVVLAGKILGIPIIIHESDSVPGKVNAWAGKFADKIAVSYPEAAKEFPEGKVAWTGNPVRREIGLVSRQGAKEYLNLEENVPVIFAIGGSQGSKIINDVILDSLKKLLPNFQIIHQVGEKNYAAVKETSDVLIMDDPNKSRYKSFKYMDDLAMRMTAGAADLVITRAGSTLFEISIWGLPSIVIPITESNGNHQRKNAYTYARSGAGTVIEEANLSDDILIAEINRIMDNKDTYDSMVKSANEFAKPEAAKTIAEAIIDEILSHNKKNKND